MTTEDLVETLIQEGVKAYKKLNRNTEEGKKLTHKEPVTIQGVEFSCWREYAVYKTAEWIHELVPTIKIEVELDENDTVIKFELDDTEQKNLDSQLYAFLSKQNLI